MKADMAILIVAVFLAAALGSGCQSYEACTRDCSGKFCGDDDGCGGYCTDCPAGQICNAATWQCQSSGCVPSCTNKTCGAYDGCGGRCTDCPGDGICDAATWTCQGGCNPDCSGKTCGDYDGCGGRCINCPVGQSCDAATWTCQSGCTPNCAGKMCGDSDGCGGFCSTCPAGQTCTATGQGYACVPNQEDLALVSDSTWRSSLVEVTGWTTVGFDDSGWSMAVTPAPERCGMEFTPELMGRPYKSWERPGVQTMWSREQQRFVYVRKSFYVSSVDEVTSAMVSVISDDDHFFYVNGTWLYAEQDGLAGPIIETDLAPYLRTGTNVIAIIGDDSFGGCRWLMVNGTIAYGGCTPNCAGRACGDNDGCGGKCTGCPSGQICNAATWQCQGWCGNGACETGESCSTCSADCGSCQEGCEPLVWDLNADFSTVNNPNGAWTYGWTDSDESGFTLSTHWVERGIDQWGNAQGELGTPIISHNSTDQEVSHGGNLAWEPGETSFHPGPNDERAVVRWTAPTAGTYRYQAYFYSKDSGATTVHVLNNGISLFDNNLDYDWSEATFDQSVVLSTGDRIDSMIGYGTDWNYCCDTTGISVSVSRTEWNLAREFSGECNPTGAWSYGETDSLGAFNIFTWHGFTTDVGNPIWGEEGVYPPDPYAHIWKNMTSDYFSGVDPGQVSLHSGCDNGYGACGSIWAVARWTSPISGSVSLTGFFGAGNDGTPNLTIVRTDLSGSSVLWHRENAVLTESFSLVTHVEPGTYIDFVVAEGYYGCDTPLEVHISQ